MAAFKIELKKAQGLLSKLGFSGAKKANEKKVAKWLSTLPEKDDIDDDDLDKKDQRTFDEVCEAVAKDRKIEVTSGDNEEEEEDEKPVKKAKAGKKGKDKKEAKPKKGAKKSKKKDDEEEDEKPSKKAKKGKKKSGGGGPSNKDRVFELWLKSTNPGKDAAKWIKKIPELSGNTIRGWISNWKKGPGEASYPRAASGRDKEIKKALKSQD